MNKHHSFTTPTLWPDYVPTARDYECSSLSGSVVVAHPYFSVGMFDCFTFPSEASEGVPIGLSDRKSRGRSTWRVAISHLRVVWWPRRSGLGGHRHSKEKRPCTARQQNDGDLRSKATSSTPPPFP